MKCVCGESLPAYLSLLQGKVFSGPTHPSLHLFTSPVTFFTATRSSLTSQQLTPAGRKMTRYGHEHLPKCVLELELERRHFESRDLTEVESMKLLLEFSLLPPWQLDRVVRLSSSRVY